MAKDAAGGLATDLGRAAGREPQGGGDGGAEHSLSLATVGFLGDCPPQKKEQGSLRKGSINEFQWGGDSATSF